MCAVCRVQHFRHSERTGMIDLHCHIIPHLDDGAFDAHVSCQMARHLLQCGVSTVVATPHSNLEGTRTGFLSPL